MTTDTLFFMAGIFFSFFYLYGNDHFPVHSSYDITELLTGTINLLPGGGKLGLNNKSDFCLAEVP